MYLFYTFVELGALGLIIRFARRWKPAEEPAALQAGPVAARLAR
jgi:hypothetical protein